MSNIININERTTNKEYETTNTALPTEKEIKLINAIVNSYPDDEMVDFRFWNGGCWQTLFKQVFEPYAEEKGLDVWDIFAVMLMKFNGTEFIENEDGSITIKSN